MEHLSADELHIIVGHIPFHHVAAGHPFVFPDSFVTLDADEVLAGCRQVAVRPGGCHFERVVVLEAAGSLLDHCEYFRERRVEFAGVHLEAFLLEVVDLFPEGLALVVVEGLDLGADAGHLIFIFGRLAAYVVADDIDAVTQLVVALAFELGGDGVDLLFEALPERTHSAYALIAE